VYVTAYGTYGHTALVHNVNGAYVDVLEQNGSCRSAPHPPFPAFPHLSPPFPTFSHLSPLFIRASQRRSDVQHRRRRVLLEVVVGGSQACLSALHQVQLIKDCVARPWV
jgi:hypothetical protein